jgi:Holliday junction resolvase
MAKAQRDKGWRTENNVRKKALDHGLEGSYRVPLSGGASIKGDVVVKGKGDWVLEIKCRANGFKQIYDWMGDNDALVIKADNKPELVVLDMGDFFDLLAGKHDV